MKTLLFSMLCLGTFSACMECEMCTTVSTVTQDGVLQSTTTNDPFEVCGRMEIEQTETTGGSTTTNSFGTTVLTITTSCN